MRAAAAEGSRRNPFNPGPAKRERSELPGSATGLGRRVLLDADALARTLAHREIIERNPDLEDVALVGIHELAYEIDTWRRGG